MLSYSPPPCLHLHLHRYPHSTTVSSSLHRHLNHPTTQSPDPVLRIHNSKTTSLLHRQAATTTTNKTENPPHGNENDRPKHRDSLQTTEDNSQTPQLPLPPQEKQNILEMSLVTKRPPQFPGSIYSNSLPSLQSVLQTQNDAQRLENDDNEDEEVMIRRALEIRRKVTAEVFKGAMKKGKFGITYLMNLVNRLPEFIDNVMIEAAALKRLPEFKESTFN